MKEKYEILIGEFEVYSDNTNRCRFLNNTMDFMLTVVHFISTIDDEFSTIIYKSNGNIQIDFDFKEYFYTIPTKKRWANTSIPPMLLHKLFYVCYSKDEAVELKLKL